MNIIPTLLNTFSCFFLDRPGRVGFGVPPSRSPRFWSAWEQQVFEDRPGKRPWALKQRGGKVKGACEGGSRPPGARCFLLQPPSEPEACARAVRVGGGGALF